MLETAGKPDDDQPLNRVEIRRFRGLSELSLDSLGRFNILLGANDVGKTSVLEAIFLLTGFVNQQLPIRVQDWRGLPINTFDDLEVLFYNIDLDRPIDLAGHSVGPVARRQLQISAPYTELDMTADSPASPGTANDSARTRGSVGDQSSSAIPIGSRVLRYDATVEQHQGERSSFSGTLRVVDANRIRFQNIGKPSNDHTILARYVTPRPGYDGSAIATLIVRKQVARLVNFLKVINPRIGDIATSGDIVYVDIGLDRLIPLNMFGGAMVRAASLLSHCILGNERILLVDELENGLHHAAVRPLLRALLVLSRDQDMQVFVTTHSVGVLESLLDVLEDDGFSEHRSTTHCFTLQRDRDGRVHPYRYEYSQFEHCVRHGIEIR